MGKPKPAPDAMAAATAPTLTKMSPKCGIETSTTAAITPRMIHAVAALSILGTAGLYADELPRGAARERRHLTAGKADGCRASRATESRRGAGASRDRRR